MSKSRRVAWAALGLAVSAPLLATDSRGPPGAKVDDIDVGFRPGADGLVVVAMDPSVDACDDFYRRACGGFADGGAATPTDAGAAMVQKAFDANLEREMTRLLDARTPDPELGRLRTFMASCRGPRRSDPGIVSRWLRRIDAADDRARLQALIRELSVIGVDAFVAFSGEPDSGDGTRYRGELNAPRLWAERAVVERAFVDAGVQQAVASVDAAAVADMVASLRAKRGDRYDPATSSNPRTAAQLSSIAPHVDWSALLRLVGASPEAPVNVTSPAYLEEVDRQLATRSPRDLRAFLRWSFLFSLRGELPARFGRAFGDIDPSLRVKTDDPAGYCRDATVRAMGIEFSRQYSLRVLGDPARAAARRIAAEVKGEIVASVAEADWLSPAGRRATVAKLTATDLKIGFPDHWPATGRYPLAADGFLRNVLAARRFEQRRVWHRAGAPRSREDWDMTVRPWVGDGMAAARLVVPNGFPDAFTNSLIMTAAFLAPPRFDADAPPEINYATFGAVFAHEFVHVAQTHEFDARGRPRDIWNAADVAAGERQGQCVIDQADGFSPAPGIRMPGARQFGENVADFGGVRLAYEALARRLGAKMETINASGSSPARRFFYRYAQSYCVAQTLDGLRRSVATDGHAPSEFRVNGPLSNMPQFARGFGCRAGSPMVRDAARVCRVW